MKVLSKNEVDIILKEALNELMRKGQSITPAAVNAPAVNAPKNPKLIAKPVCTTAYYGKPDANGQEPLTVRINNIHAVHQNTLMSDWAQKYGQIFSARVNQSQRMGNAAAPLEILIAPGQEDAFVKIVPDIVRDIANLNGVKGMSYDANYLNNLQLSILGRMDEAPTEEDLLKAQERQRTNLSDILAKLSDPNFTKKLGFVGGVSVNSYSNLKDIIKQGNSVGWRISPLNQLMVLSYLPNATFVTNAWTWEHVFNREVINEALFALEVKVFDDKPKDVNSRIQACAQLGYIDSQNTNRNPWDVFKAISNQLSQSQRIAVEFLANIINPNEAHYIRQKVYDISNTRLIAGKPDVWNEEVNFADNIRGIPNAKAQEYLAGSNGESANTVNPQQVQWVPKGDEEVGDIIESLSAICARHCGKTPNTVAGDSLGDTIAHFAEFYAQYYVCPNRQIVKNEFVTATCNAFAIGLASIYGFSVQRRGNQLSAALKDPKFQSTLNDLWEDFMDLVSELNTDLLRKSNQKKKTAIAKAAKPVAESIDESLMKRNITFKDFANLIINGGNVPSDGIVEEEIADEAPVENIQESFFKMLDKLERIND